MRYSDEIEKMIAQFTSPNRIYKRTRTSAIRYIKHVWSHTELGEKIRREEEAKLNA